MNSAAANGGNLTMPLSKRASFLVTYRQNQTWSLPNNLIFYISKNPSSSKCYEKMVKSCKYFFIKYPLLVIPDLLIEYCVYYAISYDKEWHAFIDEEFYDFRRMPVKCWITEKFCGNYYGSGISNFVSTFTPKIYQCDAKVLELTKLTISLKELAFLGSKCEKAFLCENIIKNEDESIAVFEEIFGVLKKVNNLSFYSTFHFSPVVITSKTVQELLKIPHFPNLKRLNLYDIPEAFDIESFFDYIKNNKKTKFSLPFCYELSDAYENRLHAIVDEILATEHPTYELPWIAFAGVNQDYNQRMMKLFH